MRRVELLRTFVYIGDTVRKLDVLLFSISSGLGHVHRRLHFVVDIIFYQVMYTDFVLLAVTLIVIDFGHSICLDVKFY
jgi:hypothetical protein